MSAAHPSPRRALTLFLVVAAACSHAPIRTTYPGDRLMWDGIFARAESFHFPQRPVAAIAPHHLIDASELAGFWTELLVSKPSTVVVLGPDHFLKGRSLTGARTARWSTEYGTLQASPLDLGLELNDERFEGEHSIHVHSTFLARLEPQVRFVPVLLRWGSPRAELEALARRLHETLPPDALVVASVDFSHYQPEPWATFHDASAYSTITSMDLEGLFFREVDSPESLFVALRFAQLRGAQTAQRWLHTNSQRRRTPLVHDSTSHQYFTVTTGPVEAHQSISLIIPGELPPSTLGLGVHERWTWSPDHDSDAPTSSLLAKLRGKEDRFFMGPELVVFDLTAGARLERTQGTVMLTVRSIDWTQSEVVEPTPRGCSVLLVRGAPPLEALRRLAVKHDVVIGRGVDDEARPIEWLEGHLVAPSLGAWKPGVQRGVALGITCSPRGVTVTELPLRLTNGVPAIDFDELGARLRPAETE